MHHVRWSKEVFDGYTHARMAICAADFKQMETTVDPNVSGAPAFAACMRICVGLCLCTVCAPRRACICRHAQPHQSL